MKECTEEEYLDYVIKFGRTYYTEGMKGPDDASAPLLVKTIRGYDDKNNVISGAAVGCIAYRKGGEKKWFISDITAKDGLLWEDGKVINLPRADAVAHNHGFPCAERMVKALEAKTVSDKKPNWNRAMRWCEKCHSYHVDPRTRKEHAQLMCKRTWCGWVLLRLNAQKRKLRRAGEK